MSLSSAKESTGRSFDIFDTGVNVVAAGTTQVKIYVPKAVPDTGGPFQNTYNLNVTELGELAVDFDFQTQVENVTDFKFNVPSLKIKAHDQVSVSTLNFGTPVNKLSEAMLDMPAGFLATIELSFRNTKTFFYVKKDNIKVTVKPRDIEFEGVHPLSMSAVPFGRDNFEDTTAPSEDLLTFGGYVTTTKNSDPDEYLFRLDETTLLKNISISLPNSFADVAYKAPSVHSFLKETTKYLGNDTDNITVISRLFPETPQATETSAGTKNCTMIMAGEGFAVSPDEEVTFENVLQYNNGNDDLMRILPSTEAFSSSTGQSYARIDNDQLKTVYAQLARMDAAMFGSILGESFYVFRGDKSPSNQVTLSEDDFLSLEVKREPVNAKTFNFQHVISRSLASVSNVYLSSVSAILEDPFDVNALDNVETINENGTKTVDINFEPATFASIYNNDQNADEGKNTFIVKVALENDGPDTGADVMVAPIYYNSSTNSYELQSQIEQEYIESAAPDIIESYKRALKLGDGTVISGEINDIDTLRPYNYISIDGSIHPAMDGKDFRISKISYNLEEDKIKFEAYEFSGVDTLSGTGGGTGGIGDVSGGGGNDDGNSDPEVSE